MRKQHRFLSFFAVALCLCMMMQVTAYALLLTPNNSDEIIVVTPKAGTPTQDVSDTPIVITPQEVKTDAPAAEKGDEVIIITPQEVKTDAPVAEKGDEVIIITPQEVKTDAPVAEKGDETIVITPEKKPEAEQTVTKWDKIIVADAAMYRGTITNIKTDKALNTVDITLKRADGTAFTPATAVFTLDNNTKMNFKREELAKGQYIELYYGKPANEGEAAKAIAVNWLNPSDMTIFNGEIVEFMKNDRTDGYSLRLKPIGRGMETVFHISDDTQMYVSLSDLQVGDKVNIFYNGVATMSIPPQSNAAELHRYTAP